VSRLERNGKIPRLSRGLYQLPDAPLEADHALAEARKLVPRAIVCLTSALAFHDLTDRMPAKVWLAITRTDRPSRNTQPPMRFVRFSPRRMTHGVTIHPIEGVGVPITDPAYTVIDMFRYRGVVGLLLAIEGLKEALGTRTATPAELAKIAIEERAWGVRDPISRHSHMTAKPPPRNIGASVRQRLLNLTRAGGPPFNILLTRYVLAVAAVEPSDCRRSLSTQALYFILATKIGFSFVVLLPNAQCSLRISRKNFRMSPTSCSGTS
jgi:hypothetical protein